MKKIYEKTKRVLMDNSWGIFVLLIFAALKWVPGLNHFHGSIYDVKLSVEAVTPGYDLVIDYTVSGSGQKKNVMHFDTSEDVVKAKNDIENLLAHYDR